jgi:hypothetical protein
MAVIPVFRLVVPQIPILDATQSQAILRREVGTAMTGVVDDIATEARARTPVGVSGILRASIGTRVSIGRDASTLVLGEVFTGAQAPYAIFVEEGRRPGSFPPRAPLELWAQRVLGDRSLWYVIARAIARRGIRPRRMFAQAFERVRPTIEPRITAAVERAARLLQGGR